MTAPDYPRDYSERFYGRRVWDLGDDGSDGVMVEGCDRRSWAALNAHARGLGDDAPRAKVRWVAGFDTGCGCTDEEHQKHIADDIDCIGGCGHVGLPPCGDEFAWVAVWADTDGAPALPVLVGRW